MKHDLRAHEQGDLNDQVHHLEKPHTVARGRKPRAWEVRDQLAEDEKIVRDTVTEQLLATMGGLLTALKAPPMNDVLEMSSHSIGSAGFKHYSYASPIASLAIANTSANPLTVSGGAPTPSGAAPGRSRGVLVIPSGVFRVFSLRDLSFTVYGAQGSNFDFTAYVRPQAPNAGNCGVG